VGSGPGRDIAVAPRDDATRYVARTGLYVVAAPLAYGLAVAPGTRKLLVLLVAGGAVVLYYLWGALLHRNARLLLGDDIVGYRLAFARRRTVPLAAVTRAHVVWPRLKLFGADGRLLMSVKCGHWSREDVHGFEDAVNVAVGPKNLG
jgi:hypothetical protein